MCCSTSTMAIECFLLDLPLARKLSRAIGVQSLMEYTMGQSNSSCLSFRKIKIGDKNCSLQPLIGCPFGSSFQVEVGGEGPFLSPIVPNAEGMTVC